MTPIEEQEAILYWIRNNNPGSVLLEIAERRVMDLQYGTRLRTKPVRGNRSLDWYNANTGETYHSLIEASEKTGIHYEAIKSDIYSERFNFKIHKK